MVAPPLPWALSIPHDQSIAFPKHHAFIRKRTLRAFRPGLPLPVAEPKKKAAAPLPPPPLPPPPSREREWALEEDEEEPHEKRDERLQPPPLAPRLVIFAAVAAATAWCLYSRTGRGRKADDEAAGVVGIRIRSRTTRTMWGEMQTQPAGPAASFVESTPLCLEMILWSV